MTYFPPCSGSPSAATPGRANATDPFNQSPDLDQILDAALDEFDQHQRMQTVLARSAKPAATQTFIGLNADWLKRMGLSTLFNKELQTAATTIQRIYRGHRGRLVAKSQKEQLLPWMLFEIGKKLTSNNDFLKTLPKASKGTTPVYLPEEFPIVLKNSGNPANFKRCEQMQIARQICRRNGYKDLVIPKARPHGTFVYESKLPITQGSIESIGLYIENRGQFTNAVKEFTEFLCQSHLGDIVQIIPKIAYDIPTGRYDNVALYLENGRGKIGLIDLERFSPGQSRNGCHACEIALRFFPHHLEEIIHSAKKFYPNMEVHRQYLECERNKMVSLFNTLYEDHANFIKEKGITVQNPLALEKLGEDRIRQLQSVLEEKLRTVHKEESLFQGCLGDNPEEVLRNFKDNFFPQILHATYQVLNEALIHNIQSQKTQGPILSNLQLVLLRQLEIFPIIKGSFISNTHECVNIFAFDKNWKKEPFSELLFDTILEELARGRDVAYYNPCGFNVIKIIHC